MQIDEKDFDDYLKLFLDACQSKSVSKNATAMLIEKL